MTEWHIQSRSRTCQVSHREFEDKETYHTLLFHTRHGLERLDVCEEVYKRDYASGVQRDGLISQWKGVYQAPPPPEPDAVQKGNAESLLRELTALGDPQYATACYILAVMLERKRQLKVREQVREESGRFFVYEHPKTGEVFTIRDPELRLDQLMDVQVQVAELLEHGLPKPGVAELPMEEAAVAEADPSDRTDQSDPTDEPDPAEPSESSQPESTPVHSS